MALITGILTNGAGVAMANAAVTVTPVSEIVGNGTGAIARTDLHYTTNGSGLLTMTLLPGAYVLRAFVFSSDQTTLVESRTAPIGVTTAATMSLRDALNTDAAGFVDVLATIAGETAARIAGDTANSAFTTRMANLSVGMVSRPVPEQNAFSISLTGLPLDPNYTPIPANTYGTDAAGAYVRRSATGALNAIALRPLAPTPSASSVYRFTVKVRAVGAALDLRARATLVGVDGSAIVSVSGNQNIIADGAIADLSIVFGRVAGGLVTLTGGTLANWNDAEGIRFSVRVQEGVAGASFDIMSVTVESLTAADAVEQSRSLADTALSTAITGETAARTAADATLSGQIAANAAFTTRMANLSVYQVSTPTPEQNAFSIALGGLPLDPSYTQIPSNAYGVDAAGPYVRRSATTANNAINLRPLAHAALDSVHCFTVRVRAVGAVLGMRTRATLVGVDGVAGTSIAGPLVTIADGEIADLSIVFGRRVGGLVTLAWGTLEEWAAAVGVRFGTRVQTGVGNASFDVLGVRVEDWTAADLEARARIAEGAALSGQVTTHINATNNPHDVTAAQVGLGEVDNTSDLAKPISTATQAALTAEAAARLSLDQSTAKILGEDEFLEYPVAWQGPDGRVHGFIRSDGTQEAVSFRSRLSQMGEDAPVYEGLIVGSGNDLRVGWDHSTNGGLVGLPSVQLAGAVLERTPPTLLRSGQVAFGVRETPNFRIGVVPQRNGFMAEVVERRNGVMPVAVARSPAPMEICFTMGQSNAGTGGVTGQNPRKLQEAFYPNHCLTFARANGDSVQQTTLALAVSDLSDYVDLLPWRDSPSGAGLPPNQGIMIGYGLEAAYRRRGEMGPGILGHVNWFGGQPLGAFIKGQPTYENMVNHAAKYVEIAAKYGRTAKATAIHFIQGESFSSGYQATLNQLCTDLRADVTAATGQATPPVILVMQINGNDDEGAPDTIALEQLAVARARPTEVKISAPMYQGRFPAGDTIHLTAESRMMIAEAAGEVHQRLISGAGWSTFEFTATRSGAVITLDYQTNGMELEFDPGTGLYDDGWVKPVANFGFGYSDASSGATISTVEIVPGSVGRFTRIRITLSTNPGAAANKVLTYARNATMDTTIDGWANARGQVRLRSGASAFAAAGFRVPRNVYHYPVQQEASV